MGIERNLPMPILKGPNEIIDYQTHLGLKLTQGMIALIDTKDYGLVKSYRWYAIKSHKKFYAMTSFWEGKNKISFQMHRLIMGFPQGIIDHKNRNGLDNRRENFRPCTLSQNSCNSSMRINNKSGVKGVSWNKQSKKWVVSIGIKRKTVSFGGYTDKNEAIEVAKKAYASLHKDYQGELL
jgi:hypothetical protein